MSITISLATKAEQSEASAFIFADAAEAERESQTQDFMKSISSGEINKTQILIARDSGALIGVGVLIFTDLTTAFLWPPFTNRDDCAEAILQEMATRIDQSKASIGQSLLEPGQMNHRRLLSRNGFPHLTNLMFMRHSLTKLSQATLNDEHLQWIKFDEHKNRKRFLDLLELTHQSSHDCPALNQSRTAEESLESHRSSGDSDQNHWYLCHRNGVDLGVLLMTEHKKDNVWEVVYMGVAPEYRGNGYGATLIQHGLLEAQTHSQMAVILAVDYKNSYAIKIYEELGFVSQYTLSVHARICSRFPEKTTTNQ